MTDIFAPGAAKAFTIPPGAPFLSELSRVLVEQMRRADDPDWLGDALIYLPNQRSVRSLAYALFEAAGGKAMLLPDIRALGELEQDEAPSGAEAAFADLPPAISPAQRIGQLTRLVLAYNEAQGLALPATAALSAARELASLLDQADLSGAADLEKLEEIVLDKQLAAHWERSLEFLRIIIQQWPAKLDDQQAMNPYARRLAAAEALAAHWREAPPTAPVIIAGSTGATPASRLLMRAALDLPQGLVVFPGLDQNAPISLLKRFGENPSHPQFALSRTLDVLGLSPASIPVWPGIDLPVAALNRKGLVHESLAPAEDTASWNDRLASLAGQDDVATFVSLGLEGLSLLDVADDVEEAEIAALLLREALEREGETAALVTPDAGLGRHVACIMKRWGIEMTPSAGLPLLQTDAGSFAGLVLNWMLDTGDPASLLAVLRHSFSRFEDESVEQLDLVALRGVRKWRGLSSLRDVLERRVRDPDPYEPFKADDLNQAIETIEQIIEVLAEAGLEEDIPASVDGSEWLRKATSLIAALAEAPAPWRGETGAALSALLEDLFLITGELGHQPPSIVAELFDEEASRVSCQLGGAHPRIAIWGPLEARLQTADHIILAGLNEGIWPAQPAADAFLARRFRSEVGLADPDERIGLSAHDFAQLACAPRVTMLCSKRREDKPAVASRWVWRLRMLARSGLGQQVEQAFAPPETRDPRVWLEALEAVEPLDNFSARPQPKPPVAARPGKLSVTRIESLIRDPYAIYCQYVLGLYRLDPLNLPVDVRSRGTAIHKTLERFELEEGELTAQRLLSMLEVELAASGESAADLIALREKRREVAEAFIAWRGETDHQIAGTPLTEIKGGIDLDIEGAAFRLEGTADRIERRPDGSVAILDFKSGKPPTEAQVRSGLSPQMPLQGLIAQRGGYEPLGDGASVSALTYLQFGTKFDVRDIGNPGRKDEKPVADIIAEAEAGLVRLLTQFADPAHPYLSAPVPERVIYASDYVRLARRDEWAGLDTYD